MLAVPEGIPIIYDSKRGDISTTAEAYAEAAYNVLQSDAVTINPYMGWDSVEPFLKDPSKGVFVLCKTSNKSSDQFQTLKCTTNANEHLLVYEQVAKTCVEWTKTNSANPNIGLVVGATDAIALSRVRYHAPNIWILAPGVGFQGGDLKLAVQAGIRRSDWLGLLVPVSRAVSRAENPKEAARDLQSQLNHAREFCMKLEDDQKRQRLQENKLADHQIKFFNLAVRCGVLKFGSFVLKSGRNSPYFFNAGLFNTGSAVSELASCYAKTIVESKIQFDVIFGPAYKGIPLASSVAASLYLEHNIDVPFSYNRKEEKDHGEGGVIVGAPVTKGTRVLILDDVITAGTAIRESIKLIQGVEGVVVGFVIALDRQEIVSEDNRISAVDSIKKEHGFEVISIVDLSSLLMYCDDQVASIGQKVTEDIKQYRNRYGV